MIFNLKIKKLISDIIYSFFSSALPVVVLQFVVQPMVSDRVGEELFGEILTIIGVVNIFLGMFGTPLNNTRLLEDGSYKEKGDFQIILYASVAISIVLQYVCLALYGFKLDFLSHIILTLYNAFSIVVVYLAAELRIHLCYGKILISKVLQTIGYCIGFGLFCLSDRWEYVFLFGSICELGYLLVFTNIWKEPFKRTSKMKGTLGRYSVLILSTAMYLIITYADRLIIYPNFGGNEVATYYSATIIGKAITMITGPLGSVMLTYTAKMQQINRKQYSMIVLFTAVAATVGFIVSQIMSKPLIGFLYPNTLPDALHYTPVTNATCMVGLFYSFCWPVVLKFGGKGSPIVFAIVKIVGYLSIAFLGMKTYGINSVCWGGFIATLIQSALVVCLGYRICSRRDGFDNPGNFTK